MGSTLDGPTFTPMKYNPFLAYRGLEFLITTFYRAPERSEWCNNLSLVGAICALFKSKGVRCY